MLGSTFPASASDPTPAFVRDLAAVEAERFETTVLVPAVPGGVKRERLGDLDVRRFRYFPKRWEDLADGAILENLRRRPSRWLQVVPFLIAEIIAMRRLVRRLQVDVLHVHWIVPQGVAALLGRRGRPMLVTTHGGDIYGLRDPVSRRVIRAVLRRADAVTAVNADMRARLLELGARPDQTHVLPMGADVVTIRELVAGTSPLPGRVVFVGRLVAKKGVPVLLAAMRRLTTETLDLRVVGDGPLRAELGAAAGGLPVGFAGALDRAGVARELAQAAIVVFPSVAAASGDQDGLPVALLEAMAAGRPVIVSDLPGLRDAVVDGVSGLVVPSGDAVALAAAIGRLLADADLRDRLGAAASERAEDYSVARIGAQYADLLDQLPSAP